MNVRGQAVGLNELEAELVEIKQWLSQDSVVTQLSRALICMLAVWVGCQSTASAFEERKGGQLFISTDEVLPLPPGDWRMVMRRAVNLCQPGRNCTSIAGRADVVEGRAEVFRNADERSPIVGMVIRYPLKRRHKEVTMLETCRRGQTDYKDLHQTGPTDLLGACSFGLDKGIPKTSTHWWWSMVTDGLRKVPERGGNPTHLVLRLHQVDARPFMVDVFIARDLGDKQLSTATVMQWKRDYMQALLAGLYQGERLLNNQHLALDESQPSVGNPNRSAGIPAPKVHVNRDQVFPLPPGDWQVVWSTVIDWCKPGTNCKSFLGRAQVLQNRDLSSPIYGIAIRYTDKKTTSDRFLKLCQEQLTRPYKDLHGSEGDTRLRLCSFGIDHPLPLLSTNWWWQMIEEGMWKIKTRGTSHARVMLRMHQVGDQLAEVVVFFAKDAVQPSLTEANVMEWKKAYMSALVDGFYKGRRLDTSQHLALVGTAKAMTVAVNSQPATAARSTEAPAAQAVAAAVQTPVDDAEAKRLKLLELELQRMKDALAKIQAAPPPATKEVATTVTKPKPVVVMAPRYALVVGNAKYQNVSTLENTLPDAKAFAESLKGLGFNVTLHTDIGQRQFNAAVRQFKRLLKGGEEVVFYYAGHGVQLGSANYLLPVDVGGDSAGQVRDEAIELQKVLDSLAEQKTKFSLAVIDACRDNPFKQNGRAIGGRGLAPTTAATGQMIIFSAGAGQQALDKLGPNDPGKNGLFTRVFLEEMRKPGLPVDQMLRQVRERVVQMAKGVGHEQVPALYDQAIGRFYFKPE